MAGEIQCTADSAKTIYAIIRNSVGQVWNTSSQAFQAYATGDYANFVVALTEQGTASGFYVGTFPSAIAAGVYSVVAKDQVGGSPAETDSTIADGNIEWGGAAVSSLANVITSGQLGQYLPMRIFRGQMVQNFPFYMVSSADHVTPFVSGIISGQISRDGGAFTSLQSGGAVAGYTEIGLGWYKVNLTSGDLNANTVALQLRGAGVSGGSADPRNFGMVLQRVSGQVVT